MRMTKFREQTAFLVVLFDHVLGPLVPGVYYSIVHRLPRANEARHLQFLYGSVRPAAQRLPGPSHVLQEKRALSRRSAKVGIGGNSLGLSHLQLADVETDPKIDAWGCARSRNAPFSADPPPLL